MIGTCPGGMSEEEDSVLDKGGQMAAMLTRCPVDAASSVKKTWTTLARFQLKILFLAQIHLEKEKPDPSLDSPHYPSSLSLTPRVVTDRITRPIRHFMEHCQSLSVLNVFQEKKSEKRVEKS